MEHSASYNKYKTRYDRNGCTKQQLRRLVELDVIYAWEFEEITGESYVE